LNPTLLKFTPGTKSRKIDWLTFGQTWKRLLSLKWTGSAVLISSNHLHKESNEKEKLNDET
jgi:hypothetical protein